MFSIWCLPNCEAIACVHGRNDDILNRVVTVAFEARAWRYWLSWFDNALVVDLQLRGLAALGRAGALDFFLAGFGIRLVVVGRLAGVFIHATGLEDGPLLLALENRHFIFQVRILFP